MTSNVDAGDSRMLWYNATEIALEMGPRTVDWGLWRVVESGELVRLGILLVCMTVSKMFKVLSIKRSNSG